MSLTLSRKTTLLLSIALLPLPAQALANDAEDDASDIVVTGTRVSERTATTSPVPIDVFRGEDIRASGYQETTEILRQLAPSFAFATPTTPDGNTHTRHDVLCDRKSEKRHLAVIAKFLKPLRQQAGIASRQTAIGDQQAAEPVLMDTKIRPDQRLAVRCRTADQVIAGKMPRELFGSREPGSRVEQLNMVRADQLSGDGIDVRFDRRELRHVKQHGAATGRDEAIGDEFAVTFECKGKAVDFAGPEPPRQRRRRYVLAQEAFGGIDVMVVGQHDELDHLARCLQP